jgi:hypothetical protein
MPPTTSETNVMRQMASALVIPGLAAAALCVVAGWLWLRPATATASSTSPRYTVVFVAEGLLDQSERSVWIPDDVPQPYTDISFRTSHVLDSVTVVNGDNFPHHDVHTVELRVQLFRSDRVVLDTTSRFESPTAANEIPVGGLRVDRIRVTILSAAGPHGCLADVRWVER